MKAERIGRALGIGFRVAGRIAGQRIAGDSAAARPVQRSATAHVNGGNGVALRTRAQDASRATAQVGRGVQQGVSGFLRPFRRVGGIVWLEVTGVFFLLFALVFGWYMWQGWSTHVPPGWNRSVAVSAVFMLLFLYLGVSSFWRASRR